MVILFEDAPVPVLIRSSRRRPRPIRTQVGPSTSALEWVPIARKWIGHGLSLDLTLNHNSILIEAFENSSDTQLAHYESSYKIDSILYFIFRTILKRSIIFVCWRNIWFI